jgi:hypothetical protein
MKKALPFLFMLLLTVSAAAQTSTKSTEERIKALIVDSFQDIFSNLDPGTLDIYYTHDFLLLENGEVWDINMIKDYMNKAAQQQNQPERINSFEFVEIKIEGNIAWTAYHNKASFEKDGNVLGEMNWLESATAIKTEEGWKLQMLHSTVVQKE